MKYLIEIDIDDDLSYRIQCYLETMIMSMNVDGELDNYYPSVNVSKQ